MWGDRLKPSRERAPRERARAAQRPPTGTVAAFSFPASGTALVVAFAGPAEPVGNHVMRLQLAEHPRPAARSIAQDARHRQLRVVLQYRLRYRAEESKRTVVPVTEPFAGLHRIGLDETGVAVRQVHRKKWIWRSTPAVRTQEARHQSASRNYAAIRSAPTCSIISRKATSGERHTVR